MRLLLPIFLLFSIALDGVDLRAIVLCDTKLRDMPVRKMTDFDRRAEARASHLDAVHMEVALYGLADELGLEAEVTILLNEKCTLHSLVDELERIDETPEILLFYYSGHGSHADEKEPLWPVLEVDEHSLPLMQVAELLHKKKGRLAFVIADCCNHLPPEIADGGQQTTRGPHHDISRNLTTLFAEPEGTLVISGSSPGQQAFSREDMGGLFTTTLLQTLEMEVTLGAEAGWEEVLAKTALRLKQSYPLNPQTPVWAWY